MIEPNFDISVVCASGSHVQGIAVDAKRECLYFSFTTCLVKTDMAGNLIGSVTGLVGHLGCIAFCEADGRVYGSLEYKNDIIGRNILASAGHTERIDDARQFYEAWSLYPQCSRPVSDPGTDAGQYDQYHRLCQLHPAG